MSQNKRKKTEEQTINQRRFNVHCGTRLRNLRCQNKYTQTDLGKVLNYSFQQIQKYEKGDNVMSGYVMGVLANYMNVNISYFSEGFNFNNFTSNLKYEDRFPEVNRCNQVRNEKLYPNPNSYGELSDHMNVFPNETLKIGQ
jgi:transcriptional regulator with XRE-family HTH domain|tara:strand:- start:877 stop:1299 length:423 start_codon:yes stop_codon:yes gene_type:complete